jgi:hypothetical protein
LWLLSCLVFLQANFHTAAKELQKLGKSIAFVYTTCVLFPETFIHKHQVGDALNRRVNLAAKGRNIK